MLNRQDDCLGCFHTRHCVGEPLVVAAGGECHCSTTVAVAQSGLKGSVRPSGLADAAICVYAH